ncbi:MAG: TraR/DksA C4-type zinc finger protein [Aeromicrobium erythreum]
MTTETPFEEIAADLNRSLVELQERLAQRTTHGPVCGDAADRAEQAAEAELEDLAARHDERALDQVERALARIARGEHGRCERCDGPIPLGRLRAFPRATMCLDCVTTTEGER